MTRNTKAVRSPLVSLLVSGGLVGTILLSGCAGSQLRVGDCVKEFGGIGSTSQVSTTSCDREHYGEVIGAYVVTADEFPGVQELADLAEEGCKRQFREYVGIDPATSLYDLVPLTPSEKTWEKGDYEVVCVARSATGDQLTESIKGTRR